MSGGLSGKRIVITGSSQGIGRAIALRCAREGARVVLNASGQGQGGREEAEAGLGALVREIEAEGGEALYSVGSVAEVAAADRLIATAVEGFGGLDGLVNVAGIAGPSASSIREISVEDWRRVVAVHLDGTFFCCRAAVPHLIAAGGGAIVNTSSHGHLGGYGGTAYGAAKGGINSLSYALAADLASDGIRVNAVCPGAKTRLSSGPEYEALITDLEARGLLSPALAKNSLNAPAPEGCAALYAYLLSDSAGGITGELFSASGPYVGVFDRSDERMLGFRQPSEGAKADDPNVWTLAELAALVPKRLAAASEAGTDSSSRSGTSDAGVRA